MTTVDDSSRGIAFLKSISDSASAAKAYICDPYYNVHTPINYYIYSTPTISRSFGSNGDKWIVAGMYNDSITTYNKDIRCSIRNYNGSSWLGYHLDVDTSRPAIFSGYDVITNKFILSCVNNSDEIEFKVVEVGSSIWSTTDTNIKTFEGATIACDEVDDHNEGNCLMVWADIEANHPLKWARFDIDDATGVITVGTVRNTGYIGTSRPSVTNNLGSDLNPEFLLSFTQSSKIMYMRTLNGNSTSWEHAQHTSASSDGWFGPGHVGYRNVILGYPHVYYAE